ncbi:MAG: 16S rRNA (cytidine(1402)-2'-O)-methyltransferase [Microthrixaceae bacterium]
MGPSPRIRLVATPIGNLDDLTVRAAAALRSADVVACEDTRRTGLLLRHLGIRVPRLVVLNDHTERSVAERLVADAAEGLQVVVVSDAGMPLVSDPGHVLVRVAIEAGIRLESIPGPSALLAALVVSGLPADRFVFEGFLPRKGAERRGRLAAVAAEPRTTVLYEAPHRLVATIGDLSAVCGASRSVALARELTKLNEEVWRGTLGEAVEHVAESAPRGEYVVVLGGAPAVAATTDEIRRRVDERSGEGLSTSALARAVAEELGVPRREVYDLVVSTSIEDRTGGAAGEVIGDAVAPPSADGGHHDGVG